MRVVFALFLAGAVTLTAAMPAAAQTERGTEVAQPARQRIVITPGRTTPSGPNAKRECRARLVEQHRASGTVIVPVMNCWWE